MQRITRETAHVKFEAIQNGTYSNFRNIDKHKYIDEIFDYTEHLEQELDEVRKLYESAARQKTVLELDKMRLTDEILKLGGTND